MSEKKRNWKKRLGITAGVLIIVYAIFGFLLSPLLIRYVGLRKVNEALAGKVSIEAIRVNPFACSLTLRGISVATPNGEDVFTAERFYGNFAFWSLFGKGWRFQEVHLSHPLLSVVLDSEHKLNLMNVIDLTKTPEPADVEENARPIVIPLVKIDRMWIDAGRVDVALALPGGEFRRQGQEIDIELSEFSTDPHNENPYAFVARTTLGEAVEVRGQLKLNPLSTSGTVLVDTVQLADFDTFTGDLIGFGIAEGRFSLGFDYFFSPVSEPHGLFINQGHIRVEELALQAKGEETPFQKIGLFEAQGFGIDLLEGSVSFDSIQMDSAYLRVVRDKEGLLNLIRYIFPQSTQAEIVAQVQAERTSEQVQQKERDIRLGVVSADQDLGVALTSAWNQIQRLVAFRWKLKVGELNLANNVLELRDEYTVQPVDFALSEVSLQAKDMRNFGAEPFPFELSLATTGSGKVAAQGSFTPEPESAQVKFDVKDFSFVPFAPYLALFTTAELASAKASASGSGSVSFPEATLPKAELEFTASLNDLRINAPQSARPVLEVSSVLLEQARASSEPIAFHADLLLIKNPSLTVVREQDGQINLLQMIPILNEIVGGTVAAKEQPAGESAGKPVAAAAQGKNSSKQGSGDKADTQAKADAQAAAGSGKASAQEIAALAATGTEESGQAAAAALTDAINLENFSLRELRIEGGRVSFIDNAVVPPASFVVSDAQFKLTPIELKEGSVSRFDGSVALGSGASGSASINGELITLDPLKSARFSATTAGITLGAFGGYSDPMVGRPLEQGTLDAQLTYTVADSKLKADNSIRMKQVEFGDRRAESTGPRLPLDMGMAILTDRNGVMRLDVPISGNLKDPDFDLTQVIQYAIINIFEKLVTAPFAVLGSLLDSSGDEGPATYVTFQPGKAVISAEQQRGLQLLAETLYQRPTLALILVPVYTNTQDLESLREQLLQARIDAYAKENSLSPERAVDRLYQQLLDALPAMNPQSRAAIEAMIEKASGPLEDEEAPAAGTVAAAGTVPGSAAAPASGAGSASGVAPASGTAAAADSAAPLASAVPAATDATPAAAANGTGGIAADTGPAKGRLTPPPPVVEGSDGASIQTVHTRSVSRARAGSGFITTVTALDVLVPPLAPVADEALAAAEEANRIAAEQAGADAASAAGEGTAGAGGEKAVAAVVVPAKEQQRREPSQADKRTILLSQTMVSKASLQQLVDERTAAITQVLTTAPQHPLDAERISVGAPWEPKQGDSTQKATPSVYFDLGTLKNASAQPAKAEQSGRADTASQPTAADAASAAAAAAPAN